jgi:hypothetical protein
LARAIKARETAGIHKTVFNKRSIMVSRQAGRKLKNKAIDGIQVNGLVFIAAVFHARFKLLLNTPNSCQ